MFCQIYVKFSVFVFYSFYNNIMGIPDPQVFTPPTFCKGVQLEEDEEEEKHSFLYSLFWNISFMFWPQCFIIPNKLWFQSCQCVSMECILSLVHLFGFIILH